MYVITKETQDLRLKQHLCNYLIIRSVGFLENVLKKAFIIQIDSHNANFDADVTLSLKDLRNLRETTQFTNGEIISNNLNFQDFYEINKNFSKLTNRDYLKELRQAYDKQYKNFSNDYKSILELIDERHRIVHDLQNTSFTSTQIMDMDTKVIAILHITLDILFIKN